MPLPDNMTINSFRGMRYVIRYPKEFSPARKYPLLIFLHGAGTRGDFDLLPRHLFFASDVPAAYPLVTAAPHCPGDTWFDAFETLTAFAESLCDEPWADTDRIYAMGASMGGYAVWQLGMSIPDRLAAIVPICGGGMYWNAGRLRNVAVWAFHGQLDQSVLPEESVKMVNAVNRSGGRAKLTVYPDRAHDAWTPTFNDSTVFDWLLAQKRTDAPAP